MSANPIKVDNLKKVTLSVEAGKTRDAMDLTDQPISCEFIFGIGKEGFTPFEYELADKTEGETVSVAVERDKLSDFFEHIVLPLPNRPDMPDTLYLNVTVQKVGTPMNTEVIKAMAGLSGDCGCGCGGHGAGSHNCGGGSCESASGCNCGN